MAKDQTKKEDGFEQLEGALTSSEQFIEKNQKMIVNVVIGLIIIVGIYFGYNKFIVEPKVTEAANQIFGAQNYFEKDSFQLALNGDGNVLGFIEIIEKYSSTPSGNLACLYAGLSYLHIKEYENAIKYLEKGHKVKASIRFKGREMQFTDKGKEVLLRFAEELNDVATLESNPTLDGRNMIAMLSPVKGK